MTIKKIFLIGLFMTILIIGIVVENTNAKKEKIHPTKFSAIYGNTTTNNISIYEQAKFYCRGEGMANIANFTFYLPVPSYVYIETSGEIIGYDLYACTTMKIDNNIQSYFENYRYYGHDIYSNDWRTGFQTSQTLFLNRGNHIIRFYAGIDSASDNDIAIINNLTFAIIAHQKGNISGGMT